MPAIREKSLILVTGASGYIATWVCQEFLQAGHSVRGTVRSKEKGEYLQELFKSFEGRFSYVIVKDIGKKDAFDAAIEGAEGVAHIASPVPSQEVEDIYQGIINPAVDGTLSILHSAKKHSTVRRVTITSSFAAVWDGRSADYVYSEKDWNEYSPKALEELGSKASFFDAYRASKTLAERSAWDFVKENKPSFDLVTLCPPWVYGPAIHKVESPASLNASLKFLLDYLNGNDSTYFEGSFVDVRDLAAAHLKSLVIDRAGGQRFAISNTTFTFDGFVKILIDHKSNTGSLDCPQEWLDRTHNDEGGSKERYDSSKSKDLLGLRYRPVETTVLDMIESFQKISKH